MVTVQDLPGVHVALLTPMSADGSPDQAALGQLVERITASPIKAICPTGSTGEGARLTRAMRVEVTRTVRAAAPDRPVIAAPFAMSTRDAIAEATELAEAGADAVLLSPPCYYPMTAAEVTAYFRTVADAIDIPVVVYNIPALSTVPIPVASLAELAEHTQIIGIKDSSRDLEYLQAAVQATRDADFAVLTGTDTLLVPSLTLGAVGAICASANVVPELSCGLHQAWVDGADTRELAADQERLSDIVQACRALGAPASWKAALSLAGTGEATMADVATGLSADQVAGLGARLRQLGVIE